MPAALACGVLGNGLSPISSSTTSLPRAFSARAKASTVKAVSAVRFRARALRRGMGVSGSVGPGRAGRARSGGPTGLMDGTQRLGRQRDLLLRRDQLRQGAYDPRDDPLAHHLLADLALATERVDEADLGARAPVLPD